jgi:subtilisin family serine protease
VVVRFRSAVGLAARSAAVANVDASVETAYHLVPGLELLRLPAGQSVGSAVAALSRDPRVKYAVPDLIVKNATTTTPNDPLYSSQWAPAAVGAEQAWGRTTGSASVKVAILDSGVQLDHPDLTTNLVPGYNFMAYTGSTVPADDNGHGTIMAGIIGAEGNNGVGMTGMNWHVSLMPLKMVADYGDADLGAAVSAIQYAVANGAKIINASYGGWYYGGYPPERDAIAAAGQAGVLFVAAAGNGALDNDARAFYPASYPLNNVISVGATTQSGGVASFSDYGNSVQIGAPGVSVLSTTSNVGPDSNPAGYDVWSGTSVSTPIVAGAAALLWAEHPDWTMQQVRTRLLTTATPLAGALGGKVCDQVNVDAATDPAVGSRGLVCVRLTGTGNGSVTSGSNVINCGSSCGESVPSGTSVTLTATPASGSTFAGWAGACTGVGSCTVNATGLTEVRATFRASGSPPGWQQKRLASPAGRDPFPASTSPDWSSFNVAVSAGGTERAKTIYDGGNSCSWGSDTGGVFLERRTAAGWVADGTITAPALPASANDFGGEWASCANWGTVTKLSADGSTLLVTPDMEFYGSTFRCAAWVYHRGSGGWALDTVLFPPGVSAAGSADPNVCGYFGIGGAISADGTRIAMLQGVTIDTSQHLAADIYSKSGGVWSLEQQVTLPNPETECGLGISPGLLSLSGDGATLLVGDSTCDDAGVIAAGLVFAYARSGTNWTLTQTIHAPTPTIRQDFGEHTALSADGKTAVIGTYDIHANYNWVFERDGSGWHMSAVLPNSGASSTDGNVVNCDSIVENGARIFCGAWDDDVSFNSQQGAILIFDRPAGGWASTQPQAQEAFATGGLGSDWLGLSLAAPENGSFVDATMSMFGFASGGYPHDRIGYEFTNGPVDKTLTVSRAGAGYGSITSNPAAVSCGSVCSYDFADSTPVTLTEKAGVGSVFTGWSGACSGSGSCAVTMSADRSVSATFVPGIQLVVKRAGIGPGVVSSTPSGIGCSSTCSAWFTPGTKVTLKATPGAWSKFTGWSGPCTGTAACVVTMSAARTVTATFTAAPERLTVYKKGSGSGTVTSSPSGISCGSVCSLIFGKGTVVTLTAKASASSVFTGWSGACTGTSLTCHVSMLGARSTNATFAVSKLLGVSKAGTGSGQVTSSPDGISCGATCTHFFGAGTVVTMTAAASSGSKFTGWSGACSGTGSCVVTMNAAKTVKAIFTLGAVVHRTRPVRRVSRT